MREKGREREILYDLIEKTSTIHYRIIHSSLSTSKSFDFVYACVCVCVCTCRLFCFLFIVYTYIDVDLCILFPIQICNRIRWNKSECIHLLFETQHSVHIQHYNNNHHRHHHSMLCPLDNAFFIFFFLTHFLLIFRLYFHRIQRIY